MIIRNKALQIREESRARARLLGVQLPSEPPPLLSTFGDLHLRPTKTLVDRVLSLYAVIGVVLEPAAKRAAAKRTVLNWLSMYELTDALTPSEVLFLNSENKNELSLEDYESHIETLHSLAWTVGLVDKLDPAKGVDDSFGAIFPNIQRGTSPLYLYGDANPRPAMAVIEELDLYFCLHWFSVETLVTGVSWRLPVDRYVVKQRRFGLEWALSSVSWDDIVLDT